MKKVFAIVAVFVFSAFAANVTFKADFEDSLEATVRGVKTSPRTKDRVGMFDKGISGRVGVSAHCPHWNYYHKEWNREGIGRFSEDLPVHSQEERNRGHYVYSCMAPPSFMEYRIKQISYAIDNSVMDVHNLYFDLVFCPPCQSEEHGCAWTDDFGRKWSGNDWESRRAFFQIIRRKLLAILWFE